MKKRCQDCVHALKAEGITGRELLLVCINKIDSPGHLHLVEPKSTCRNFQVKMKNNGRREPPPPGQSARAEVS
jgi:hypothetical protein